MWWNILTRAALCCLVGIWSVALAKAEVSFVGETVNIIISAPAGGGTDVSARLLGNYLSKYLPGSPRMRFRNIPGGGGITANNYFYREAAADGLTLLVGSRNEISPVNLLSDTTRYNPAEFEFVGGDIRLGTLFLVRAEALHRLKDPTAEPLIFGDIDGARSGILVSLWGKEFLGWNIRPVLGYPSMPALVLAARSGELQMMANQNAFTIGPMLENGEFVAISQLGVRNDQDELERRSAFAEVPLLTDELMPKLDDAGKRAFELMQTDMLVNKWLALPPGTPAELVDAYRAVFAQVTQDPEFLESARNEIGADYTPMSGPQMESLVEVLVQVTEDDLGYINALREKNGLPLN
jgi:hypothetical protein